MQGELPKIVNKSLFTTHVEKKTVEEEAVKIKIELNKLDNNQRKYQRKLNQRIKRLSKSSTNIAQTPFSLSVSKAQRDTLKKIKSGMLLGKNNEVKEFGDR